VVLSPAACNRAITSVQHDPSANKPCTNTTLRAFTASVAERARVEISELATPATRAAEKTLRFIVIGSFSPGWARIARLLMYRSHVSGPTPNGGPSNYASSQSTHRPDRALSSATTYRAACSFGISTLIVRRISLQARASGLAVGDPWRYVPISSARNEAS